MKNRDDESKLSMAFAEHCHAYFPQTRGKLVWTHIPLSGRSAQQGAKLKRMGTHAGWFDFLFIAWPSAFSAICLEAKVSGRNYSDSQEKFDDLTTGMPVFKGKFYSVKEGHNLLIEAGVQPMQPCRWFKEPCYLTQQDKFKLAFEMYKRDERFPK